MRHMLTLWKEKQQTFSDENVLLLTQCAIAVCSVHSVSLTEEDIRKKIMKKGNFWEHKKNEQKCCFWHEVEEEEEVEEDGCWGREAAENEDDNSWNFVYSVFCGVLFLLCTVSLRCHVQTNIPHLLSSTSNTHIADFLLFCTTSMYSVYSVTSTSKDTIHKISANEASEVRKYRESDNPAEILHPLIYLAFCIVKKYRKSQYNASQKSSNFSRHNLLVTWSLNYAWWWCQII